MKSANQVLTFTVAFVLWSLSAAIAQTSSKELESLFSEGYLSAAAQQHLADEFLFQSAVQTYLWALPTLNMYGMKEGSEKVFGKGYNVLPIFKERLNAKTVVTTPNSDVIYARGYVDLKEDGPLVIEVHPVYRAFWTISGSAGFVRKARSRAGSGVAI